MMDPERRQGHPPPRGRHGSNPDSEPRIVSSATSLPGAAPLPSATHDATARSYLPQSMSNKAHFLLPLLLFLRSVRFTSLFGPWSSVELRSEVEVGEGVQRHRQIQGKRNTPSLSRSTGPVQVYKAGDSLCNAASGGLVGSKLDPTPLQGQVEQLNVRLQALESDREFMKQTIDSLKREKEELTLLKDIAQRLRESKPPS